MLLHNHTIHYMFHMPNCEKRLLAVSVKLHGGHLGTSDCHWWKKQVPLCALTDRGHFGRTADLPRANWKAFSIESFSYRTRLELTATDWHSKSWNTPQRMSPRINDTMIYRYIQCEWTILFNKERKIRLVLTKTDCTWITLQHSRV